jgi:hypothetical protein
MMRNTGLSLTSECMCVCVCAIASVDYVLGRHDALGS